MRSAVFGDAGYLFAQGSVLLTGSKQPRERLSLDIQAVVATLKAATQKSCDSPFLRIYWYDAMRLGRPTPEQEELANTSEIKIRLGQINSAGEQKGVDTLIITDLAELARNRAITDAVLVSGDEDVRVGVVLAQQFGVRVHLVGIEPARANQSRSLFQEADTTSEWNKADVARFLRCLQPGAANAAAAAAQTGLETAVETLIGSLEPAVVSRLKTQFEANTQIPVEHDRALLRIGRQHYAEPTLTEMERVTLRSTFVRLIRVKS